MQHVRPQKLDNAETFTSNEPSQFENSSAPLTSNNGQPVLLNIHCFGVDIMVDFCISPDSELLWGHVALRALTRWREIMPKIFTQEHRLHLQDHIPKEGPYEILIYEPRNRRIFRPLEVVSTTVYRWTIVEPPRSYRIVVEGSLLQRFKNQQLEDIFIYLIAEPKDLLPLLLTCKRFKHIFSDHRVWSKFQWSRCFPLFRWHGVGGFLTTHHSSLCTEPSKNVLSGMVVVSETDIWRRFEVQHSLTALEATRLRYNSYRLSRLKFFYGTLSAPAPSATRPMALKFSSSPVYQTGLISSQRNQRTDSLILWEDALVRGKILEWSLQQAWAPLTRFSSLLSPRTWLAPQTHVFPTLVIPVWTLSHYNSNSMDNMKRFFNELHFMAPVSATNYHLQLKGKRNSTLFPGGSLVEVEPSPKMSRSRTLPRDPGTRVEVTADGDKFRRIGDMRLTFLQCDANALLLSSPEVIWMRSSIRNLLLDKSNSTVLWVTLPALRYNVECRRWQTVDPELLSLMLTDLQSCIEHLQNSMLTSHWLPLLLFVGVSYHYDSSIDGKPVPEEAKHYEADETESLLGKVALLIKQAFLSNVHSSKYPKNIHSGVKMAISESTAQDESCQIPCHWYIQPYNQLADEGDLNEGILPGWNWLWRTLTKFRDQQSQ